MTNSLPALSNDAGLAQYLAEIRKFPVLSAEDEYMHAKAWQQHQDRGAVQILVTSHLRLVAKIAMGYRGYGLPVSDLIAEGNIGMMQAVRKFDPDKGFRLSTYAMWWIKAAIQEYILKSWSLVKIGTTAAQKKLFFNLKKMKKQIELAEGRMLEGDLTPAQSKEIATALNVPEHEVVDMNRRLGGDRSLNALVKSDADESTEWQDWLPDETANQEIQLGTAQDLLNRQEMLKKALVALNPRERHILAERRLREPPTTLEDLSQHYDISRERVRQIENRAFEKLRAEIAKQLLTTDVGKQKMLTDS
ncbi:MAG: RNA polymerase sigma factor RpoH [Bdellovibrionales bacterium]